MWDDAFFDIESLDDILPGFKVEMEDRLVFLMCVTADFPLQLLALVTAHGVDGI